MIDHVCQHTDENEAACNPCHDPMGPQERKRTPLREARRRAGNVTPRTPLLLKHAMIANDAERVKYAFAPSKHPTDKRVFMGREATARFLYL